MPSNIQEEAAAMPDAPDTSGVDGMMERVSARGEPSCAAAAEVTQMNFLN